MAQKRVQRIERIVMENFLEGCSGKEPKKILVPDQ
jgi:hypothetical protein